MNHEDASYLISVHIHYTCFCIISGPEINILSSCNVCVQTLTWNITEELLTEVPLCLTFVSIKVLIGPPRLLVTEKHERKQLV